MAIVEKKRKRKLKPDSNEVPIKVAKKVKRFKKKLCDEASFKDNKELDLPQQHNDQEEFEQPNEQLENDEEQLNHDNGIDCCEKEIKFPNDFKMMSFRSKLRGSNFITELRHLLHMTTIRPKIIAKYIEKRGKPLELAEALERIDKTNVYHVSYVCQALQLVVMEILTNQKSHMESAAHACRYFLKSHGAVIESLIKSTNVSHRKCALKLLTAIVCVEPQLGRQLLSSLDILSNVKTMEKFLSHSKFEINEDETVRKCYIHFVLAYLVDGNTLLVRNILDKGVLVKALTSGLLYDDHITVCVVLSTLKQYVLECAEISKTKKIAVFDLNCVKNLARLYEWRGPKVLAAQFNSKTSNGSNLPYQEIAQLVDPAEKDAVAKAAHEFLIVLLTSRKYGITFDAITHFRKKHNTLQGQIIGFLYMPWLDEQKTDLILRILRACPDLARHSVRNFAGIINPIRTSIRFWVQACDFLKKVITELHPSLLKNALDKITLTDYAYWVKDICLPLEALVHITGSKLLKHSSFQNRIATNRLLLAMFQQYSNYITAIADREKTKGNTLRRFKFDILNHILVNFPTVEDILVSLYITIKEQENPEVDVLEHLDVALDLVLVICRENRSFVNRTSTILDYLKLLRPLYANDDNDPTQKVGNIKLELKAIKAILLLYPKALEPHEELFPNVLNSFIKAFVRGTDDVQREAGILLRNIFSNTGLFETAELEIDIWLETLRFFDAETVDIVTKVLFECLQVTKAEVDTPQETSNERAVDLKNLHILFQNIEDGLSVQGYIETLTISKLLPLILKGVQIVKPMAKYLETVCLLMFHYFPTPKSVYAIYSTNFKHYDDYMSGWLSKKHRQPALEGKIAKNVPFIVDVHAAILGIGLKFQEIFKASDTNGNNNNEDEENENKNFTIELQGKIMQLNAILCNERMVMLYIQEVMFLMTHLVHNQKLTHQQSKAASEFLVSFLKIIHLTSGKQENDEGNCSPYLDKVLKYIFSTRIGFIQSPNLFASNASHLNYLRFLREITECCNAFQLANFSDFTHTFRMKIVKSVEISMLSLETTKAESDLLVSIIPLVEVFQLSSDNCLEILDLLSRLNYDDFFQSANGQKTIYLDVLVTVLHRLAYLQTSVRCLKFIEKFSIVYIDLMTKLEVDVNLEQLEEALYKFLTISHQYISHLSADVFSAIFTHHRKISKSTIKLACLLLGRNPQLEKCFIDILSDSVAKKELIYPLLNVAFTNGIQLDTNMMSTIYQAYKNGFMKTIEKPQKASVIYKENVITSIRIVEKCMPNSECVDFCNKNFKFDVIELYQVKIIQAIFRKALASVADDPSSSIYKTIFVQFINSAIQMLAVVLKRESVDREKCSLLAYFLFNWWQTPPQTAAEDEDGNSNLFSKVLKSQNWMNFCKTCLKLGMYIDEAEENVFAVEKVNGHLLKLLAFLCDKLYQDAVDDESTTTNSAEAAQLYEMIFSHSKFFDIVLGHTTTAVKTSVMHLLYVLASKCPKLALNAKQIPVILGAYQAKLTCADRYTLALLQLYEQSGIGFQNYRPFIWGESAIAFYSLRAAEDQKTNLSHQETSIAQVMSLIDRQICEYTIDNFPLWRRLDSRSQLPEVVFDDPDCEHVAFGTNPLERLIEQGQKDFAKTDLRLCPKRLEIYDECYDPSFFIPLMCLCFAPESYSHPVRPVQNGLLSIVFAALSSQDKDMRLAAGCAQQLYRQHFESNNFFEKPLWIQTYDNIQAGLGDLRRDWMKHKKNSGIPRVPYISGLFLAKSINLTVDPMHFLYKQLTMYLRLKSSFNFQCVPEFNVLFYSPEVGHHDFRQFIVEIIRNGIKSGSDLFLLVTTSTFKVLMGFYGSTMSTLDINLLILSVFSTCVKIPASTKIMIEHVGIFSWLNSILSSVEFYHFDVIEGIISILNNLWYAVKANAEQFHNFEHIQTSIHRLILRLLPNLSGRIAVQQFAKLLNIMNKTAASSYNALSGDQLDKLISCAQKHFAEQIHCVVNIRRNGSAGAASRDQFCRSLHLAGIDATSVLAISSLREYVIHWSKQHHQQQDQKQQEQKSQTISSPS